LVYRPDPRSLTPVGAKRKSRFIGEPWYLVNPEPLVSRRISQCSQGRKSYEKALFRAKKTQSTLLKNVPKITLIPNSDALTRKKLQNRIQSMEIIEYIKWER
jgi:hypothetical protein